MGFNPMDIVKLRDRLNGFRKRHPGFAGFIKALRRSGVPEGSVVDVKVTTPDGKSMTTNFRVSGEDLELIRTLSELRQ